MRTLNEPETLMEPKLGSPKRAIRAFPLWVIPTNEEVLIARDTFRCVKGIRHFRCSGVRDSIAESHERRSNRSPSCALASYEKGSWVPHRKPNG